MSLYAGGSGNGYTLLFLTDYGFILTLIYFIAVTLHFILEKVIKESRVIAIIGECINMVFEAAFAI
jgi:hypothetical protein